MKKALLLFAALLVAGCGEKEQLKEQEKSESTPKEEPRPEAKAEPKPESTPESRELPPLPETVTAEFIMGLWAKPHDERDLIEELKDEFKPGIWKVVRNIGPSKEELVERVESSFILKSVDRRFSVWEFSDDAGIQYSVMTYDYETENYRWWSLLPDGFITELSGKRYWRNLMEWKSVRVPEEDMQIRMRETVRGEKSFKATFEIKRGGELVAYSEDEATWVRELGPPEEAQEEVLLEVDRATREGILIMGNVADPKGLDPHIVTEVIELNIISALFEGLVVAHPSKDGVALPGMAEKWYPTDPQKPDEWVFELRKDAKWSDGTPLTAEDFLFAFERILTPELGSEYPFMLYYIIGAEDFHKGKTTDFSTVQVSAPDLHTLRVNLRTPITYLPEIAEHYTWFPVPKHSILKHGRIGDRVTEWTKPGNIVSNGAFILTSWQSNDRIQVERNPLYWDKDNVGINGIRYLPISNLSTENRMYFDGEMHITYTLAPELIEYARERYPYQVRNEPYLGTYFIRANVNREPFTDPRVRMAFSKAIDQQSMITNVLKGGQKPAGGLVPPFGDYRPAKTIGFDPEGARKLLTEAGYPGGEGMPEIEFLTTDKETSKLNAEALQAMWKDNLGVSIKIKQMEWTSYLATMLEKDYGLAAGGWIGDYADPLTFLDMWMKDGGNNRTGWHNEEFESLLKKAGNTGDPQARYRVLEEAEALFLSESPILPLYWYTRNYLVHPDVKGWDPLILDNHPYKFLRLERSPNLSLQNPDRIVKEVVDVDSLEERDTLIYQSNESEPFSGWVKLMYDSGQVKGLSKFKDGKPADGLHTQWYENGQKSGERTYKDGKMEGLWTTWHENGQMKEEGTYKDGEKDGFWKEWHENGQKDSEGNFKDGKGHGPYRSWYENGQKQAERTYKDGKKDGLTMFWHENGQKKGELTHKDGELVSKKFWTITGEEVETVVEAIFK